MTKELVQSRAGAAVRRSAPGGRAPRRLSVVGPMFVAPFIVVFVVFTLIPAVTALTMSFTDISARELRNPLAVDFVGFANFAAVLTDPGFLRAVGNTALFVIIIVPASMAVAFLIALMLDSGIRRLRTFFRAAVYLPVVTNIVAAAVIWQYAFTAGGPVNSALGTIGVQGPDWLSDPAFAVSTVSLLGIWRSIGTCMVLFLAGLQTVPDEVREAAELDGAGYWRRTWSMTLPLLRPTTLLVSVLMTVTFLNIFDEPLLVTNGGPLGSTKSIAFWVYEQFGYGNIAASMAGSFVLLVLVGIVAIVQFRLLRPKH